MIKTQLTKCYFILYFDNLSQQTSACTQTKTSLCAFVCHIYNRVP